MNEFKYFVGTAQISIDKLFPHPHQRDLNAKIVTEMAGDLVTLTSREHTPLSVIPQRALSDHDITLLKNSSTPIRLPDEYTYWLIDGQHRLNALRKIQSDKQKGGDEFYRWPCRVYRHGELTVLLL
jgi:hypothetical protein